MPRFKSPKGDIIEVTEIHAEQVLRPQGKYTEVFEKEAPKEVKEPAKVDSKESSAPKVQVTPIKNKKKSKKKAVRKEG